MSEDKQKVEGYTYITTGRVIDCMAGPRWYNVRTAAEAPLPCSDAAGHGTVGGRLGPTKIGTYPPGTSVVVLVRVAKILQEDKSYQTMIMPPGTILCSLPGIVDTNATRFIDWVTPFTGADAMNNAVHSRPLMAWPTAFRDFNWSRPIDAVPGSDEGLINEFGVGHGISRFFSWTRASDMAGLWCFYLDNLVRMAAYNYEFWHSGGEHTIKNDEGEINDIDLFSPYPWEALGMLKPNIVNGSYEEIEDGGIYKPGQNKLWHEPKFDDQVGIARHRVIRGYLGDMKREMVTLPKFKVDNATYVNRRVYSENEDIGVLDLHQHTDGMYTVRSARGITHEKYLFMPVPNRVQDPEQSDTLGDGLTNYRPSGFYGAGASRDIHDKQIWVWSEPERPDTWFAELYDAHAYLFNWYGIKSTVAHTKDFVIPEEGPADQNGGFVPPEVAGAGLSDDATYDAAPRASYLPELRLTDTFMFPLPSFADVQIDHRTGTSRYYFTRSIISQMPDGSILLEDGYGSSIHMTGGNIFKSCAGDEWSRTGRSIVQWAGDDFIARAGSSADISASNGDVRIKAEKNLHMLGGNSGVEGGIIIESRAVFGAGGEFVFRDGGNPVVGEDVKTYGIIFKSTDAPMMVYGSNVYVKSVKGDGGGGGGIILDADAEIVESAANTITRFTGESLTDVIGQTLGTDGSIVTGSVVNWFDTNNAMFGGEGKFRTAAQYVLLDTTDGAIYAKGSLGISNGVQSYPSASIDGLISSFSSEYSTWITSGLSVVIGYSHTLVYNSGIMGDTDFINEAGFTCRNAEQYGLGEDFSIVESRWQQMYRAKEIGILWREPQVLVPGSGDVTRPHPGDENWLYAESFVEYDPELWDWEGGSAVPRGGGADSKGVTTYPYDTVREERSGDEESETSALKHVILSDNYLVSKQIGGIDESPAQE